MATNIFLFLGNEKLITENKINKIITDSGIGDMNVETYDLSFDKKNESENTKISDVINSCLTPPFFSSKKAVIIKNPVFLTSQGLTESESNFLIKYLNNPLESTILIFNAVNLRLDDKLEVVKVLKKVCETRTTEISEKEMFGWLTMYLRKMNIDIDEDARKLFFEYVGKDTVKAENEALKLMSYVGSNSRVFEKDIEAIVSKSNDIQSYELTNAIVNGQTKKAIDNYLTLVKGGVKGDYIFNIIANTMKRLLIAQAMILEKAKQKEIAQVLQVSENQAYYIMQNTKKISKEKIVSNIIQLGELDYKIKTGKLDLDTAIEYLVFRA
ncbi:MAG: DNA polymerase III subunit delta [Bacilli bacterium]|nr:DNA polymerase III subunit delta [Bacilli bacterium]